MKEEDILHIPFRYINENGVATKIDTGFITIAEDIIRKEKNDRKPQHNDVSETAEVVDAVNKLHE